MERRSIGMMVGGGVLTGVGGISLLISSFTASTQVGDCFDNCKDRGPMIIGFLVGGLAGLAVGIPLLVYGAKRVPVKAAPDAARGLPAWAGAPGGAGWTWRL
jgi:hypothetical protein